MIKDITLGQFFPGNSVIHKLDPRMKLILVVFYIVILFCYEICAELSAGNDVYVDADDSVKDIFQNVFQGA